MTTNQPAGRADDHRELRVWNVSMALVMHVYGSTGRFPTTERFGLSLQIRRAAVSIPANIAEGNGRLHRREYAHHLSIARGSLREVSTLWEIGRKLGYLTAEETQEASEYFDHIGRMLTRLIRSLGASIR